MSYNTPWDWDEPVEKKKFEKPLGLTPKQKIKRCPDLNEKCLYYQAKCTHKNDKQR